MSSGLFIQALPTLHSPTQGAADKKSRVVTVDARSQATAADQTHSGKPLPREGDGVPGAVSKSDVSLNKDSLTNQEVLEAVQNLNDYVQNTRRELNFSVDEETGRTVVKVIDHESKKVIRQIPAEEILDVARRVAEQNEEKGNLLKIEV